MKQLYLSLLEALYRRLANLTKYKGISLNHHIFYALARLLSSLYTIQVRSKTDREQQQQNFENLLAKLGEYDAARIEEVLSQREVVEPESELTSDVVNQLKLRIQKQKTNLFQDCDRYSQSSVSRYSR